MRYATLQDHLGCDKWTAVERGAAIGLDGLELVVPEGIHDVGPDGMALDPAGVSVEDDDIWSATDREDFRRHAAEHGIAVPSLCPSYLNFRPGLTAADGEERAAVVSELRRLVAAASDLGARTVLVPFFLDAAIENTAQRRRVAGAIEPAARAAESAGVTLALETSLPAGENRALLDAIDSPRVQLYYDVGNATRYGYDPGVELRELADRLAGQIHLKDGTESGDSLLGEGRVGFGAVGDALGAIDYDGWLVLETIYGDDPVEAMAANLQFARDRLE